MLRFALANGREAPYQILCLGAHSDDIEIGCGGTILSLLDWYPNATFAWIVFSGAGPRAAEAQASADAYLPADRRTLVTIRDFRDSYFPYQGAEIKSYFEELKLALAPDLILTHCRSDLHQDHRLINELTWNTFREHTILEYEIPKYDGDLGSPNIFVHLDEATCCRKLELLRRHYGSQASKPWFTDETFRALLRLRGIEARAPQNYAEAFYGRKLVLMDSQ
jgi:LmbE family N-acetylglucosaminyl deacetylase